jgi:glycosyltransferase involved in cell wall biosynthesis
VSAQRPLRLLAYTDSTAVGGAEIALGYLLGALAPEIEVGVLATDARVGAAIAAHRFGVGARAVRAPRGGLDRAALRAHVRAIRAFAPHVVHSNHTWPWACAYGELAALLCPGVRVLAVDHLPVPSALPRRRLYAGRLRARALDGHVAVGERAARQIERLVGLRAGAVRAIANGVPAAAPESAQPPTPLASPPVVGSVGRIAEQKGYDLLVRALPALPGATLVLVGEGPARGDLERLAAELGVRERLHITGWTPNPRSHLATFDVFALPSRWEGLPLGILEAMHAGLPVVACDVGSVAEAVHDGETGFVVAPDDLDTLRERLRTLLADPQLARRLGERGRALAAERFTDTAMARRYETLYRELAAG